MFKDTQAHPVSSSRESSPLVTHSDSFTRETGRPDQVSKKSISLNV